MMMMGRGGGGINLTWRSQSQAWRFEIFTAICMFANSKEILVKKSSESCSFCIAHCHQFEWKLNISRTVLVEAVFSNTEQVNSVD